MMRAVMADPLVSAYLFFDPSRLSELAHAPVCASTLRHKPGRSTSATLTCPDGMPWGWAQVLIGNQPEKLANVHRRAAAHGGTVAVHELAEVDGLVLLGRIGVDPRLHRGLGALASVLSDADPAAHRATDVDNAIAAGLLDVLRYNALRRLVLRGTDLAPELPGPLVFRVTAARRGPAQQVLRDLVAREVPVISPTRQRLGSRHLSTWPWVDGVELTQRSDPEPTQAAGAALSSLHAVTESVGGRPLAARLAAGDPDAALHRILSATFAIAPALAARLSSLVSHRPVRSWESRHIIHGDFSADQVIVCADAPDAPIRIVDLDRLRLGDPHQDLGSFAASELRRTGGWGQLELLLSGYERPVLRGSLQAWTVQSLALRFLEPFRAASPTWRSELEQRLEEIERVVEDGVLT